MKGVTYGMIRPQDHDRIMQRFGALPSTPREPGIGILQPPPATADAQSGLTLLQTHEAWHAKWIALRRKGIGSSEVATINGVRGAYGSPFALWWDKKAGLRVEQSNEDIMVMGTRLEEVIGEVWQARNPDAMLVRPGAGLYMHPTIPWLVSTPDFLAVRMVDGDPWPQIEPVECKAYDGGKGWGTPGTDQVPEHIKVQVIMQCETLGADRGHVARMQAKRVTLYTIEAFPREDNGIRRALVHHWITRAAQFFDSLNGNVPPSLDGSTATEETLAALHDNIEADAKAMVSADTAARYAQALHDVAAAKERLLLIKNVMRQAMGNAEFATDPDGNVIAQRRHYKRAAYTVPVGEVDGIWPVGNGGNDG